MDCEDASRGIAANFDPRFDLDTPRWPGAPAEFLAQHHLGLALQDAARGFRQLQCTERLAVWPEMAQRDHLARRLRATACH